jgi:hypothetical protein
MGLQSISNCGSSTAEVVYVCKLLFSNAKGTQHLVKRVIRVQKSYAFRRR